MILFKRILFIILKMTALLLVVSMISFWLVAKAPIDPLVSYIGTDSTLSDQSKNEIIKYWGLNEPIYKRYVYWIKNVTKGNLGESITYKRPVIDIISERFSYSIMLMIISWISSGILGYAVGIVAGIIENSAVDKIIQLCCIVIQSAPSFWFGLIMLSIFSVKLGWFPMGMAIPVGKLASEVTFWERIHHLILPAITLTIIGMSKIILFTRQKVIDVMNSGYIVFAKARGENTFQIVRRHLIRNTAIPIITLQFSSFSELFGGMALAETVFAYPGIGSAMSAAAANADAPLLLGIALFSAVFVFVGNLVSSLIGNIIDPRLRRGEDHVQ